jgi:hypothetical protein
MSKKLYFRTNTNKTNKSILNNAKHNDTNSKTKISMMSSLTDTKLEGKSSEEPEKVFEKLIINYSKINDKNNINDYCIESSQKDFGFLNEMLSINKQFDDFIFSSPREEGEQCQLVEKSIVDKCRQEKEKYIKAVNKLTNEVEDLKSKLSKAKGENNFVKQAAEYQNRLKSDNAKQIEHMQTMLEECKLQNKLYREELTKSKIQKDSLMNALTTYISKYDIAMAEELKNLVNIYNNQYYKVSNMGTDERYIDDLFSKIKVYERKIVSKNKEIKELEQYLVLPGDKYNRNKNKNLTLKKPKTARPRPHTVNKTSIDASARNKKTGKKN